MDIGQTRPWSFRFPLNVLPSRDQTSYSNRNSISGDGDRDDVWTRKSVGRACGNGLPPDSHILSVLRGCWNDRHHAKSERLAKVASFEVDSVSFGAILRIAPETLELGRAVHGAHPRRPRRLIPRAGPQGQRAWVSHPVPQKASRLRLVGSGREKRKNSTARRRRLTMETNARIKALLGLSIVLAASGPMPAQEPKHGARSPERQNGCNSSVASRLPRRLSAFWSSSSGDIPRSRRSRPTGLDCT